jgi:hypothetical protein
MAVLASDVVRRSSPCDHFALEKMPPLIANGVRASAQRHYRSPV